MELTVIEKIKADNARINISLDPEKPLGAIMTLEYTCPMCAGRGCNNHSFNNKNCSSGQVKQRLDPANLNQVFDMSQLIQVKSAIINLYNLVIGD